MHLERKVLFSCLFFCLCFTLKAEGNLKELYKKKDYHGYIYGFDQRYQKTSQASLTEQYLYGESLVRLSRFKESNKFFIDFLKRYLPNDIAQFQQNSPSGYSKSFILIIKKITRNILSQYLKTDSERERKSYLNYVGKLSRMDQIDEDFLEDLNDDYLDKKEGEKESHFNFGWSLDLGYFFFKFPSKLMRNSDGQAIDLLGNASTLYPEITLNYGNSNGAYFLSGKLFYGSATVQSQGSSLNYRKSRALTTGVMLEFGYLYKIAGKSEIGVSLNLLTGKSDFKKPRGFAIKNNSLLGIGFNIHSYYHFSPHWALGFKIGDSPKLKSGLWQFSIRYSL